MQWFERLFRAHFPGERQACEGHVRRLTSEQDTMAGDEMAIAWSVNDSGAPVGGSTSVAVTRGSLAPPNERALIERALIDAHAPRENDHRSCIGGGGGEGDFSQDLDSRASLSRIISFAGMSRLQTGTLNSVIEGECAAIAS